MPDSLQLVFQYFLAVGSGVGLGLVLTVGLSIVIYNKFIKEGFPWRQSAKKR